MSEFEALNPKIERNQLPCNLRILVVCSGNRGEASPFIREQADQLVKAGCVVEFFLIKGKGWMGYLKNRRALIKKIQEFEPDIVHAHSGMSALLAGTQRMVPVVATFHGSDVYVPKLRAFTRIAVRLSKAQVTVSAEMKQILGNDSIHVIPCAVDTSLFYPTDQLEARLQLGWSIDDRYILFSSAFDNPVKNASLAREAVDALKDPKVHLVELKGRSRKEVAQMMNACDVALMTSFNEGSSQFLKEAMACDTTVVSTRVGIVANVKSDLPGLFLVDYKSTEVAEALRKAIDFSLSKSRTNGPAFIMEGGLTPESVTEKLLFLFRSLRRNG
jgi:glycosyltransferase involved in cell wall biosynthesis